VPKVSFTTILLVVICAGIGYLAFDPDAGRDLTNWIYRQVGRAPDPGRVGYPNYTPVIPGK